MHQAAARSFHFGIHLAYFLRAVLGCMHMACRFDIGTLESPRQLPNGSWVVDAKLTRTGVFTYRNSDGSTRREFRPTQEVFDQASLATFPHTVVTNDHPDQMVTPDNAKAVAVGTVGTNVRKVDTYVAAPLVIFDGAALEDIKAGKVELSCGYNADIVDEAGISPDGEHYDCVQSNIRINHVAIVDVGRAGPEARIRMDAAMQLPSTNTRTYENTMDLEQALQKINDLMVEKATQEARADRAEKSLADANTRADAAEAQRDDAKERADKAESDRKDSDAGLGERVAARVELQLTGEKVLGEDFKADASDREIKVAVVKELTGFEVPAERSEDYLRARFDAAVENMDASAEALGQVRQSAEMARHNDSDDDPSVAAEKAMHQRHANAKAKAKGN